MNRCPITYGECDAGNYSKRGLRLLNRNLSKLNVFPLSAMEQRREAIARAGKISIQGVQPKLSASLSVKNSVFEIVDRGAHYILKPQHGDYPQLPENEGLTMHMADIAGMDVPLRGLIYSRDGSLTYFVRRFDRAGKAGKLATEDFAQLSGKDRSTKYRSSMEKLAEILDEHCTFPAVEKLKLFKRSLFSYLSGNEDMHLKNFSLIRRRGKIELAPLYDHLNSSIALQAMGRSLNDIEEVALPLRGKKHHLTRRDWVDYYGIERLKLNEKVITECMNAFSAYAPKWFDLIKISFLSHEMKKLYSDLLAQRCAILGL
ncbi:MAG: HipA domain-containing protein [Candidatus Aegiribacteria sp.]|nr:HipA domain-containing protein [Candidatus Aegiribacteria sp.]